MKRLKGIRMERRNKYRIKKNRSSKRGQYKFRNKKDRNNFPPQDTSSDIICGDPTEDYRY